MVLDTCFQICCEWQDELLCIENSPLQSVAAWLSFLLNFKQICKASCMKKNCFEQILRPLLSEGKSFGKENEKGIVIPGEETTCATNFGRSSVHPITSREKKKTFPTQPGQSRMMCFAVSATAHVQSHSPRVRPVCTRLNKTPVPAGTAAPAPRGEPRHRGPTFDGTPGLDLPGRTQRQQKPRGRRRYDLKDGVCVCTHLFLRYSCI